MFGYMLIKKSEYDLLKDRSDGFGKISETIMNSKIRDEVISKKLGELNKEYDDGKIDYKQFNDKLAEILNTEEVIDQK